MLAQGVSRRRKVQIANFLATRTLRRMFSYTEFPRALGRSQGSGDENATRDEEIKNTDNFGNFYLVYNLHMTGRIQNAVRLPNSAIISGAM